MKSLAAEIIRYLLGSFLLASLFMATVFMTTPKVSESLFTLQLHFPLFLLISIATIVMLPNGWRSLVYLGVSCALLIEFVVFVTVLQV